MVVPFEEIKEDNIKNSKKIYTIINSIAEII
jgi:hypothetical protein